MDFFGEIDFEQLDNEKVFGRFQEVVTVKSSTNINVLLLNGIKTDFVNYSYPWLEPAIIDSGVRLAGIKDEVEKGRSWEVARKRDNEIEKLRSCEKTRQRN